ncbi:arachidonate 12-lipoxygenase, 12R-type [Anopheles sinensis]|uniref:Arachidonate 12-lipoxygenase, 12R-type n=1 Tax=Anopheles sinensis TaxID=74873 RepID=A0A084VIT8_ANOSI|nr:arachidonate 12-lipoxygenase, 12R-type [Anopheles sinensis]
METGDIRFVVLPPDFPTSGPLPPFEAYEISFLQPFKDTQTTLFLLLIGKVGEGKTVGKQEEEVGGGGE